MKTAGKKVERAVVTAMVVAIVGGRKIESEVIAARGSCVIKIVITAEPNMDGMQVPSGEQTEALAGLVLHEVLKLNTPMPALIEGETDLNARDEANGSRVQTRARRRSRTHTRNS